MVRYRHQLVAVCIGQQQQHVLSASHKSDVNVKWNNYIVDEPRFT